MKRWSLLFLVVGLLVGVVAGLFLDKGVSAQRASVQGTVMYIDRQDRISSTGTSLNYVIAYCFTQAGGIHCLPAR